MEFSAFGVDFASLGIERREPFVWTLSIFFVDIIGILLCSSQWLFGEGILGILFRDMRRFFADTRHRFCGNWARFLWTLSIFFLWT